MPNFTLYSRNRKGNSIDYSQSASFDDGKYMRDYLIQAINDTDIPSVAGIFGSQMHIQATIDGPINHIREQ